eukprot:TCONS_00013736-protein
MNPLHCLSFFWLMLVLCYGAPTNTNIKDESDETIKLLESKDLAVVKFYSDSCVHCKTTSESFLEASKKIKESNPNITILEVNTDNNHKLAERDGVQMIPAILFYKKGEYNGPRIHCEMGFAECPTRQWHGENMKHWKV